MTVTINDIFDKYPLLNDSMYGTDKGTIHSYIDFYEKTFETLKEKPVSVLEIGIRQGASLFLWSEYFKECSIIIGIDIDQTNLQKMWQSNKIQYIFQNAYDLNFYNSIKEKFDIIIDDGPHTLESQCFSLSQYIKKLNPDGILIIEDIQTINNAKILQNILPKELQKNIEIIDLRSTKNRYDDILAIYRNVK